MRRLFLLRHAKSDWGTKARDDHDRPLNARGRSAALRIGNFMRAEKRVPACVLCSTAVRTRETLELLLPYFAPTPELNYERKLYLAECPTLLEAVRHTPYEFPSLLVIGHNPGIAQLAELLAAPPKGTAEGTRRQRMTENVPTGTLACLNFGVGDWHLIGPGMGRLVGFTRPKDLPDEDGEGK